MPVVATFIPAGAIADLLATLGAVLLVVAAGAFVMIRDERRRARAAAAAELAGDLTGAPPPSAKH